MWKCPNCGENSEDGINICWSCGTDQEGSPGSEETAESIAETKAEYSAMHGVSRLSGMCATARFFAGVVIIGNVVAGGFYGAALGSVSHWSLGLLGAIFGAMLGFVIGNIEAFAFKSIDLIGRSVDRIEKQLSEERTRGNSN